ncbi:MAG: DNA-deoxyinosine glycosylase [Gammaproteobacteria bacterium]
MSKRRSLSPVARPDARLLILGSMPGTLSLQEQQYYAQPRNAFWQIMGQLFGAGRELDYAARLQILEDQQVALWDALATCYRPGSMDADIRLGDAVANDFRAFFARHAAITHVYFNGVKAGELYTRLVLPTLTDLHQKLPRTTLPSTSPANAAASLADKVRVWRKALVSPGKPAASRR